MDDAVEILAQWMDVYSMAEGETARHQARALLAEIAPMIVADAVAKERDRCAKVALTFTGWVGTPYHSNMDFGPNIPPKIAAAIRAGGEG